MPAGHGRHVVRSSLTTFGALHSAHCTPKPEYVVPIHATQDIRSTLGSSPGSHRLQLRCMSSTTFGTEQFSHCPRVENVVPTQLLQTVLSPLGPLPAGQAEHVVRSPLTTRGALHSEHSVPKTENVAPVHDSHLERSADGALPAGHASQNSWLELAALPGSLHGLHLLPAVLTFPARHASQFSWFSHGSMVHSVPAKQLDGSMHCVLSALTSSGARHRSHTP